MHAPDACMPRPRHLPMHARPLLRRAPADFDWRTGAPRPRYVRCKSLTSTGQEGVIRFGQTEWAGLPDGEYLFSIDTGAVECGAVDSHSYCVSERVQITNEAVTRTVGLAHGAPLAPRHSSNGQRSRPPSNPTGELMAANGGLDGGGAAGGGGGGGGPGGSKEGGEVKQEDKPGAEGRERSEGDGEEGEEEEEEEDGSESPEMQYMFEVPLLEYAANSDESADVKRAYALVDRLSYLDWGLRTEDEVVGKRSASLASHNSDWNGCIVHDGSMWGEAAHGFGPSGPRTARTSEGYGEATVATAEKLLRLLRRLTSYVPAMSGWAGPWNLDADATFCDVGSGYGKVIFHAKLNTGCRSAIGIECVAKRAEISTHALQGLYGELDRERLSDDLLRGVAFEAADATQYSSLDYSHLYMFDRVFSHCTLAALAKVLQRSSFYVMISSRKPQVWWDVGLHKVQPVAKMRFKTTGREGCTAFIYINKDFIPPGSEQRVPE